MAQQQDQTRESLPAGGRRLLAREIQKQGGGDGKDRGRHCEAAPLKVAVVCAVARLGKTDGFQDRRAENAPENGEMRARRPLRPTDDAGVERQQQAPEVLDQQRHKKRRRQRPEARAGARAGKVRGVEHPGRPEERRKRRDHRKADEKLALEAPAARHGKVPHQKHKYRRGKGAQKARLKERGEQQKEGEEQKIAQGERFPPLIPEPEKEQENERDKAAAEKHGHVVQDVSVERAEIHDALPRKNPGPANMGKERRKPRPPERQGRKHPAHEKQRRPHAEKLVCRQHEGEGGFAARLPKEGPERTHEHGGETVIVVPQGEADMGRHVGDDVIGAHEIEDALPAQAEQHRRRPAEGKAETGKFQASIRHGGLLSAGTARRSRRSIGRAPRQ